MAGWTNNGSYQDLTKQVLPDSVSALAPTSQQAGNQVWANNAQTAPGGESGDLGNDIGARVVVPPPVIDDIVSVKPGQDGKPQARGENWSVPGPPGWGKTAAPVTIREK